MADAGAATSADWPRRRWWRGLAARATLIAAAMLATLSVALIGLNAASTWRAVAAGIEQRAGSEAAELARRLQAGELDSSGFVDAASDAGLDYAYLETAAGMLVAGKRPVAGAELSRRAIGETQAASLSAVASEGGVAHAAKALSIDGEPMTARVGLSLEPARAAAADAAVQGLMAALVFIAVALPILALLVDRIAAPLRALTRAVRAPGSAQAELDAASERPDEIGALARAHLSIARDLAQNADALHRLTFDDTLTKLPNRASLISRLTSALQFGAPLALIKFEVEGLSRIAAALGQQCGDEAVRHAADRLREAAADWAREAGRPDDPKPALARISDTGFAMIVSDADAGDAKALAEAALEAFEAPLIVGDHHVATTLAIGVALAPEDGDEAGALLRSASAAVSSARAAGPQSARFAGAELNRAAYGRLKLEQELRRAIDNGDLELHYQPQIALRTGMVSGAEALVRWRHPIRGMVSPMEFVPLAEECGLIEPLGRLVLGQASRMAADWRARAMPIRIAVNVSAIQFRRPSFAAETLEIIKASGADAAQIELEITESAAMRDAAHAARELQSLKAAGVRVAIDDFGTGFSNLSSLTRLPFDVLKIDRAFVRDAATAAGARAVVGAVMGLAGNLGFETVAEGVETDDQLAFVAQQGCTHVQGYLFAKPMSAPAFEAWYAARLVAELRALAGHGPAAKGQPGGGKTAAQAAG